MQMEKKLNGCAKVLVQGMWFSSGIAQSSLQQPLLFNTFINNEKDGMDYSQSNGDRWHQTVRNCHLKQSH